MIWLSWRLHRAAVLGFAAAFGVIVALYLVDALRVHDAYIAGGLDKCVGVLNDSSCHSRRQLFIAFDVGWLKYLGYALTIVSGMLGLFLGAPMVSTEFERGTWQWVWSQRISRTRWLAVNFVVVATIVAAFGAALGAAYTWWERPVVEVSGPMRVFESFDNMPQMCAVYSVFGFAVGVAASTFLRRTLAAMGVTFAVFMVTRFSIAYWLRPHYLKPVVMESPATDAGRPLTFDERDWEFFSKWVDAHGNTLTSAEISRISNSDLNPAAAGREWYEVLQLNGIHYYSLIHPYQRAGTFQLIESGIYLGLIVLLAALAFWRIRRRTA